MFCLLELLLRIKTTNRFRKFENMKFTKFVARAAYQILKGKKTFCCVILCSASKISCQSTFKVAKIAHQINL